MQGAQRKGPASLGAPLWLVAGGPCQAGWEVLQPLFHGGSCFFLSRMRSRKRPSRRPVLQDASLSQKELQQREVTVCDLIRSRLVHVQVQHLCEGRRTKE